MAKANLSPKSWERRYAELLEFLKQHGRHPSRYNSANCPEASLAWWVKDQRRKMRYPFEIGKRGGLTGAQVELLHDLGIVPVDPREPRAKSPKPAKAPVVRGQRPRGRPKGVRSEKPAVSWYREGVDPPRGRLWLKHMEQLREFLETQGRPPSTEYTASPAETKLARWMQRVARQLRRPYMPFPLSEAEARIFAKAGVKCTAE